MPTFEDVVEILDAEAPVRFSDLPARLGVAKATVKKAVNRLLAEQPHRAGQVTGFIPNAEIVVDAVEAEIGRITSDLLYEANIRSKALIDQILSPEIELFVREALSGHMQGDEISISLQDLVDFISNEYSTYAAESGNGVVSVVGRLNEQIFIRSLENSDIGHEHFRRSGNDGYGDIMIHQRDGLRQTLYVEVKSYHARERLLRGLQDIVHPAKVGVGFFQQSHEFNARRTQTLLDTGAWAIYLPTTTFNEVDENAKARITGRGDRLYRPLEMFVQDMEEFVNNGRIRQFH